MAFEAILAQADTSPRRWRRIMFAASIALHAALLIAGLIYSVWQVEEMPMPSLQVTLTAAPPPPPPPPPPAARSRSAESKPKTRPVEVKPRELEVPKEVPKEQPKAPEATQGGAEEKGEAAGQLGGVQGGVAGGVVGGVVGSAPPPPPPKASGPENVSAKIARGLLAIDPSDPRYSVKLPPPLARSGETYVAMLRVCVSAQGSVSSVQLMKGASPAIDGQLPTVIGRWRYRPRLVDGQPTPFCYPLRYEVSGR